jgi:hypothetical protein
MQYPITIGWFKKPPATARFNASISTARDRAAITREVEAPFLQEQIFRFANQYRSYSVNRSAARGDFDFHVVNG